MIKLLATIMLASIILSCISSENQDDNIDQRLFGNWISIPENDTTEDDFYRSNLIKFEKQNIFTFEISRYTKEDSQSSWVKNPEEFKHESKFSLNNSFISLEQPIPEFKIQYIYYTFKNDTMQLKPGTVFKGEGSLQNGSFIRHSTFGKDTSALEIYHFKDSILIRESLTNTSIDSSYFYYDSKSFYEIRPYKDGNRIHTGLPNKDDIKDTLLYPYTFIDGELVVVEEYAYIGDFVKILIQKK